MNKIILVADSTCDLSKQLIKERDIKIVPLYVTFDDDVYRDGVDITPTELYEKVLTYKKLPKTSAISPGDFITFFEPFIEKRIRYYLCFIGFENIRDTQCCSNC